MTFIEFFDRVSAENICASLSYIPDRVIYIGEKAKRINTHIENYKRVFEDRGHNIEFIAKTFVRNNQKKVIDLISELVETYDDCVFDITGGDEMLILALGMVFAKYPDKNIKIHKFNLKNNKIYDCDMDGITIFKDIPELSVEENIRIYGGDVVYGEVHERKNYRWDLNSDFRSDIDIMWNICRADPRNWNLQMDMFSAMVAVGRTSEDGLTVTATRADTERYLLENKSRYKTTTKMIADLVKNGLIICFSDSNVDELKVGFKNKQVKRCLTNAGTALEMKVYIIAKNLCDFDRKSGYNDVMNGVFIDWDGVQHDEETENVYDTENEIDVMLMKGVIPIFISCKNGNFGTEELYKLNTVAERFGGSYAKKVLVTTRLDKMGSKGKHLRQRINDMGILLIDDIISLSDDELAKVLCDIPV